jgi:hypothetical protein
VFAQSPPVLELESSAAEASRQTYERRRSPRPREDAMKGAQKPKKVGKKPAQKTLKERRAAKRAAAKHSSRGLDV